MNKCHQCKQSVATGLKLRCLFLKEPQYCSNCRTELSFSLFWAVFYCVLSFFGSMFIGLYLSKGVQSSSESMRIILVVWLVLTLLGIWVTLSFLPLVPYKDWYEFIFNISNIVVFTFGGVLLVFLFYQSFISP